MPNGAMCTGFIIKRGVVATAAHCVDESIVADVEFFTGRHSMFTVVDHGKAGTYSDWGLLVGKTQNIQPFSFPAAFPELPFSTLSVGYGPQGPQMVIPQTVIGGERDSVDTTKLSIVSLAAVDHGDSGGPLLGPGNTLLGIVYAMTADGTKGISVPYTELQRALLKNHL